MSPDPGTVLLTLAVYGLLFVGLPGALLYLAFRFVRAYEQRARGPAEVKALAARVAALEERLGHVAGVAEPVAEGRRFDTQVLAGHPAGPDERPTA